LLVKRVDRSTCVMLAALGCLSIGDSQASEGIGGCESIYPGAVYANYAAGGKVCSVEWVPGSVEHVNDFAAQCRNLTGGLYVDFVHDETAGRVACLFKPAIAPGQARDRMAELQAIVQSWTDSCMEKERKRDTDRTSCWLTAVEALHPYAADASAPFAKQVSQLQSAWLHRARDLLTIRAQLVERLMAASRMQKASASRGCAFDPIFDGARCRTEPAHVAQSVAPAATPIPMPVAKEKIVERPKTTSAAAIPDAAKAKKPNRRKNFSRIQAAAVKKAKAQLVKLAVPRVTPALKKKLKAAAAKWKDTESAAVNRATPRAEAISRKHALLTKTSTTSKCLNSLEWC
jgi:hypothetical protein